jgi:hypothetical protein
MSSEEPEEEGWEPPKTSDCDEEKYPCPLPAGASDLKDRYIAVLYFEKSSRDLVRFAIIQQTFAAGTWKTVAEIDTCHHHVHIHRWSKQTNARVGESESLHKIGCADDVQTGYNISIGHVTETWQEMRREWQR